MNRHHVLDRRARHRGVLGPVDLPSHARAMSDQVGRAAVTTVRNPERLVPRHRRLRQQAIFLDRDGVIIQNRDDYVKSIDEVRFLPGSLGALRRLSESEYVLVLVTNQSAVGRGVITLEDALEINGAVIAAIEAAGGRIDASYLCPHCPDDGCDCRKPAPGMILRAADELRLDLRRSFMVGDARSDVLAAVSAGVWPIQLVADQGGDHGSAQQGSSSAEFEQVRDLQAAVELVLGEESLRSWKGDSSISDKRRAA